MRSLLRVDVEQASLEVPLEDFEHLPRELGCSLHRTMDSLVLAGDNGVSELHFDVTAAVARLTELNVARDPHGGFFMDVVALLFQLYGGDLSATLTWDDGVPTHVELVAGEAQGLGLGEFEPDEADVSEEPRGGEEAGLLEQALREVAERPPEPLSETSREVIDAALREAARAWAEYRRLKGEREKQSQSLT